MKHKLLYTLVALMTLAVTSCKDDDLSGVSSANELDRMPRAAFCHKETTGESGSETDCHLVTEEVNTIYLSWFKINGAAGYQIRYAANKSSLIGNADVWESDRIRDIYVGSGVMDVLSDDIKSKAKIITTINSRNDFEQMKDEDEYVIIPLDINEIELFHLSYSQTYNFAIKTLSPRGREHDSEWYGYGDSQHWAERLEIQTGDRVAPEVVSYVSKSDESITFFVNLNVADVEYGVDSSDILMYDTNFEKNGDGTMYVADMVKVYPQSSATTSKAIDNKWIEGVPLSQLNVVNGMAEITVDGLDKNTMYVVKVLNSHIEYECDAAYLEISIRTSGPVGDAILIEHATWANDTNLVAHEYQACRIDGILSDFMDNTDYPEGQVFYLEGGKLYYIGASFSLYKGFTLETDPADISAGKGRAKVYMGGLVSSKGNRDIGTVGQLVLGRAKVDGDADSPLLVDKIIFNNLDIQAPQAVNYGASIEGKGSLTGNYFLNMLSTGMGINFDALEIRNCTFQGLIRGFFRLQGTKTKRFNRVCVDNCVFYNCGYYAATGASYSMFAGDGASPKSNPWVDFQFTNNTIYDSPWQNIFLPDNNTDLAYGANIQWNVRIENNTFINFNTRASGRYMVNARYIPSGSYLSFKNNLIVLAKDARDIRNINNQWGDIRQIQGDGIVTFDVEENYSVGCEDSHLKTDGIWTGQAISANKNSIGALWDASPGLVQGDPEFLAVKVGSVALLSTELFKSPNPPYYQHDPNVYTSKDHIAPDNIWDALTISPSGRCTNDHEIIVKKIGAPRWYSTDPENYTIN